VSRLVDTKAFPSLERLFNLFGSGGNKQSGHVEKVKFAAKVLNLL
jgi:hypothetical protein